MCVSLWRAQNVYSTFCGHSMTSLKPIKERYVNTEHRVLSKSLIKITFIKISSFFSACSFWVFLSDFQLGRILPVRFFARRTRDGMLDSIAIQPQLGLDGVCEPRVGKSGWAVGKWRTMSEPQVGRHPLCVFLFLCVCHFVFSSFSFLFPFSFFFRNRNNFVVL